MAGAWRLRLVAEGRARIEPHHVVAVVSERFGVDLAAEDRDVEGRIAIRKESLSSCEAAVDLQVIPRNEEGLRAVIGS